MRKLDPRLVLAVVVLAALLLRLWGIGFGLPYLYHPDEPNYVSIVQNIIKTGDLNPHRFRYPSLFFYLNAIAYIPYYLFGKLVGVFNSVADIPAPVILNMGVGRSPLPSTFLLGRVLTVGFSTATVLLVFVVGRETARSEAIGLLAALMLAVSPTNVTNGRFIAPNAHVTFFVVLATWAAVRVLQQGKTWQYAFAGVVVGLAASTKYNAALIVLSVVLAHFLRCGLKGYRDPRIYLALVSSAAVFLLTTPFAILDLQTFFTDLGIVSRHYTTGHAGAEGDSLRWYLTYLWTVEGVVSVLALIEVFHVIYARSKGMLLVACFPVFYLAFISLYVVRNPRTLLPLTPFLFLLASSLAARLFKQVMACRSGARRRLGLAVGIVALLALLGPPFARTLVDGIQLNTVDSRETARVWIEEYLPEGARIVIESYSPYVNPERFSVEAVTWMISHPPEWYVSSGFEYLVFGQEMFGRFYKEPDKYPAEISRYEELFHSFHLVRAFTDGGYEVRIYQVAE